MPFQCIRGESSSKESKGSSCDNVTAAQEPMRVSPDSARWGEKKFSPLSVR